MAMSVFTITHMIIVSNFFLIFVIDGAATSTINIPNCAKSLNDEADEDFVIKLHGDTLKS